MQSFFGPKWDAPNTDDAPQVETPIGDRCYMCDRTIADGDQGWMRALWIDDDDTSRGCKPAPVHRGCEMGTTIGHTFGFCDCTGWHDYYVRGKALIAHLDRMHSWTVLEMTAVAIAEKAHAGQQDKSGEAYIEHPLRVMDNVTDLGETGKDVQRLRMIAVLHDVLEDSNFTPEQLHQEGIPVEVVSAVVDLTHFPHEPREYYYERVKRNPDALKVKLADIADNSSPERLQKLDETTRLRLIGKYDKAIRLLVNE